MLDPALIYMPGELYCPKCNFRLHKRVMDATTGEIGISPVVQTESCLNGCGAMLRVTWKQEALELREVLMRVWTPDMVNA